MTPSIHDMIRNAVRPPKPPRMVITLPSYRAERGEILTNEITGQRYRVVSFDGATGKCVVEVL